MKYSYKISNGKKYCIETTKVGTAILNCYDYETKKRTFTKCENVKAAKRLLVAQCDKMPELKECIATYADVKNLKNSYLGLVCEKFSDKHSAKTAKLTETLAVSLKDALVKYTASLAGNTNIYDAIRNFINEQVDDFNTKTELLDTIAFCESENADLEETLIKAKIAIDNNLQESIKTLKQESVMSPATGAYPTNLTSRKELDPIKCFIILDRNNKPMLSRGGIVITNAQDAEDQIQKRADDLYRLIHDKCFIYVIEDEAYDKCVDIHDEKEYVKFIKANAKLIKPSKSAEAFKTTSEVDDVDFLIDVNAYWQGGKN